MMTKLNTLSFLLFTTVLFPQRSALAQDALATHPDMIAIRTESPPVIDGYFDADEWKGAATIENFTQVIPKEGVAPTEKTVVHVLYDSDNLYIGIQCFDSQPEEIIGRQMQKEIDSSSDDLVEIVIDPFADKRNGYYLSISAAGGKRDGLVDQSRNVNYLWDGLWIGKAQKNGDGWSTEIAIPFRSISFREGAKAWGINFQRVIRRKQEVVRWSGPTRNQAFLDMVQAGSLSQMVGLKQGLGLTLKPYSAILVDLNDGNTRLRPGFDMAYKLTPSTTAVITVNTDFADAEVDDLRVSLSRFPLSFPEKRAFFLQDASLFSFGGLNGSPLPFYSRRIGLVNGEKKDILAGAKVTGREGFLNFGVLDVQMYDDPDLGKKNLSVGRVLANVFDQSTAGILVTHGDPDTTGDNTMIGSDFNYQNSHMFGDKTLKANAWGMASISTQGPPSNVVDSGVQGNDYAFGADIDYPNDNLAFYLYAGRYGENFRPALGFMQRPATWEFYANARYRWRTQGFLRRIDVLANNNTYLYLDGGLQSSFGATPAIELEDEFGDVLYIEHFFNRDVLREPDPLVGDITLAPGTYQANQLGVNFIASANRALSGSFYFGYGSFYGGILTEGNLELIWKPNRHLRFSAKYGQSNGSLPQGDFVIRFLLASANVIFTPELSWNTRVQWDTISSTAGLNSRLRYEIAPGQEAFLIVNQGFDVDDRYRFTKGPGELSAKLGMTFVF